MTRYGEQALEKRSVQARYDWYPFYYAMDLPHSTLQWRPQWGWYVYQGDLEGLAVMLIVVSIRAMTREILYEGICIHHLP